MTAATARQATERLLAARHSAPTAAGSPTTHPRRTWSTTTPTGRPTCSCTTGTPAPPGGCRCAATADRPPATPARPGDQRRRPLDHLRLGRGEPGRQRHQRHGRRVPLRPGHRHHPAGVGPQRRRAGHTASSYSPAISADGRWITYDSYATNLVDDDTNGCRDVFLYDRDTGTTRRVSVRSDGGQATGAAPTTRRSAPTAAGSPTPRCATNLVDSDTNGTCDVFLFDRDTGTTRRVSVRSDGGQATGQLRHRAPAISADGRWITYYSDAANLVDDDTNACARRVPLRPGHRHHPAGVGAQRRRTGHRQSPIDPAISADGRWITYASDAHEPGRQRHQRQCPTCS